ncbi:MAG: DUF3343 domain-containing protein [Clostridia bacterium]|nr:DUF3343 domain-containing protein [Clostridia bacterium]
MEYSDRKSKRLATGGGAMDGKCIRIGSVTYANKAKSVLKENGFRVHIRKTSSDIDGCSYLLEVEKTNIEKTVEILRKSEIKFTVTERCDYF